MGILKMFEGKGAELLKALLVRKAIVMTIAYAMTGPRAWKQ
jgi:hypothetical protein